MKTHWIWLLATINLLLLTVGGVAARSPMPQAVLSTAFIYQGYLTDNNRPASGSYDFQFRLYTSLSGSVQAGPLVTKEDVPVDGGLFEVDLDFGGIFNGAALFLQISVRPGASSGAYTPLTPRQPLMAAPYTLFSRSSGALHGRDVSPAAPAGGQVLKWDGAQWAPAADNIGAGGGGGDITAVIAGNGLLGGSASGDATVSADASYLQRRVAGDCAVGSSIRAINADGTIACEPDTDTDTTYTAGTGLTLSGNQFRISVPLSLSGTHAAEVFSVRNTNTSAGRAGSFFNAAPQYGAVRGENSAANGIGVYGEAHDVSAEAVYGYSTAGDGVYGITTSGAGVRGSTNGSGYAGYFNGRVFVNGLFDATSIASRVKNFKIDHPLDPANKYLYHASVESSEMKNIYDGVAVLDAEGAAVVQLPAWFTALNRDFRYQLTCIGGFAPVYIAEEIRDNRFTIAGGKPGMKVSWQITGIRHDAYANAHPLQVEADKPAQERGKYLAPREHGQPETVSIDDGLEPDSGASGDRP